MLFRIISSTTRLTAQSGALRHSPGLSIPRFNMAEHPSATVRPAIRRRPAVSILPPLSADFNRELPYFAGILQSLAAPALPAPFNHRSAPMILLSGLICPGSNPIFLSSGLIYQPSGPISPGAGLLQPGTGSFPPRTGLMPPGTVPLRRGPEPFTILPGAISSAAGPFWACRSSARCRTPAVCPRSCRSCPPGCSPSGPSRP